MKVVVIESLTQSGYFGARLSESELIPGGRRP